MQKIIIKALIKTGILSQKRGIDLLKKRAFFEDLKSIRMVIAETSLLDEAFFYEPFRTSLDELLGPSGLRKMLDEDNYNLHLLSDKAAPVVLDIGSHIGIWPRVIKSKYMDARIFSLEPDKDNFKILKLNNDRITNAKSYQYGVYEKKTTVTIRASDQNSWRSSLDINREFFRKDIIGDDKFSYDSYEIPCVSIDEFMYDQQITKVDMIGVTVPGEIALPILQGGIKTFNKFHPIISINLYPSELDPAINFLNTYGYVMSGLPKGNMYTFLKNENY